MFKFIITYNCLVSEANALLLNPFLFFQLFYAFNCYHFYALSYRKYYSL